MYGRIDVEDALAGTVFSLSAAVSTGVATISVLGFDLGGELFTLGGESIGMAMALSVAALVVAFLTNRMYAGDTKDLNTDLTDIAMGKATAETYVAGATIVVVLLNGLNIMGVHDAIVGSDLLGIGVLALEAAGYYVVSYMG